MNWGLVANVETVGMRKDIHLFDSLAHIHLGIDVCFCVCATKCKEITYRGVWTTGEGQLKWEQLCAISLMGEAVGLLDWWHAIPISSAAVSMAASQAQSPEGRGFTLWARRLWETAEQAGMHLGMVYGWKGVFLLFTSVFLPDLHTGDQHCFRWIAEFPCKSLPCAQPWLIIIQIPEQWCGEVQVAHLHLRLPRKELHWSRHYFPLAWEWCRFLP